MLMMGLASSVSRYHLPQQHRIETSFCCFATKFALYLVSAFVAPVRFPVGKLTFSREALISMFAGSMPLPSETKLCTHLEIAMHDFLPHPKVYLPTAFDFFLVY